jgi:hypothetical protein
VLTRLNRQHLIKRSRDDRVLEESMRELKWVKALFISIDNIHYRYLIDLEDPVRSTETPL